MQKDIRLLNGREISKEEFEKYIGRYKVYTDINLLMISDNYCMRLLILFTHLRNMNNMDVAHSFLAKQLGDCNEKTVRRSLNKLQELGFITWESGKKKRKMNAYTFNQDKYDAFVATLNSLDMDSRNSFVKKFFDEKSKSLKAKDKIQTSDRKERVESSTSNYSNLDDISKKKVDREVEDIYIQILNIREKRKEKRNPEPEYRYLHKHWDTGCGICGDFKEQIELYLSKRNFEGVKEIYEAFIKEELHKQ